MNIFKNLDIFIQFTNNKELNISFNNFLNLKILPDIVNILCNEKKSNIVSNKNTHTHYKTEYDYNIKNIKKLEDFLFEPYTEKEFEYLDYIKDVEDYLINKYKDYFFLILNNLNINSKKYNYFLELFFNKIQNIEIKTIFNNKIDIYNNLLNKNDINENEYLKKEKIYNIVNNELLKQDITIYIKSDNNSITLKLKQNDNEVNKLIIEEIINKFFYKDFYFFIKKDSNFNFNGNKIDIISGYYYKNNIINKINKNDIKNINLSKLSINKIYYK
tara:strand:+ start:18094 stop:18912 length:819 start_codon:yes stop_codon:yes gene_type:complete